MLDYYTFWICECFIMWKLVGLISSYDFTKNRLECLYEVFLEIKHTALRFWEKKKLVLFNQFFEVWSSLYLYKVKNVILFRHCAEYNTNKLKAVIAFFFGEPKTPVGIYVIAYLDSSITR